jgi:hypothetical protein
MYSVQGTPSCHNTVHPMRQDLDTMVGACSLLSSQGHYHPHWWTATRWSVLESTTHHNHHNPYPLTTCPRGNSVLDRNHIATVYSAQGRRERAVYDPTATFCTIGGQSQQQSQQQPQRHAVVTSRSFSIASSSSHKAHAKGTENTQQPPPPPLGAVHNVRSTL